VTPGLSGVRVGGKCCSFTENPQLGTERGPAGPEEGSGARRWVELGSKKKDNRGSRREGSFVREKFGIGVVGGGLQSACWRGSCKGGGVWVLVVPCGGGVAVCVLVFGVC